MSKHGKGWARPSQCRKWHYFDGDIRSLCGRWMFFGGGHEEGSDASPDNCKACKRIVKAAKAKGEA